jgi:hypothetical protein
MRMFDAQIAWLLSEGLNATDERHRRATAALIQLLRTGTVGSATLAELAADISRTWGRETELYLLQLCGELGLHDEAPPLPHQ